MHGRVQGVGYRYFAAACAARLGLVGWIANAPDGTVRCVAEGAGRVLGELLEALEQGPFGADVERVDAAWGPASEKFDSFAIRSLGHSGD